MDAEIKEELIACNVDVDAVMERFMGNETLVTRFLIKFLDDTNLNAIGLWMSEGNTEEAFKCAHTLKGVCANLGLNGILKDLSPMVEKLRNGTMEGVEELYAMVQKNYEAVSGIIRKLKQ